MQFNEELQNKFVAALADARKSEQDQTTGTIAGIASDQVTDQKGHFPVETQAQAQSSMARAMQMEESPSWFSGSLQDLRNVVYAGIEQAHPGLELSIKVGANMILALADKTDEAAGLSLSTAEVCDALSNDETRKVVANKLIQNFEKSMKKLEEAKQLAERLLSNGMTGEEFEQMNTYYQEDIVRELMYCGVKASVKVTASIADAESRRQEILNRLNS